MPAITLQMLKAPVAAMPPSAGKGAGARNPRPPLIAPTSVLVPTALPAVVGTTAQLDPFVMSLMTTASARPPEGSRGLPSNLSCETLVWR